MAQFQKGQGGRPKGVPNKATADLREWISNFIDSNREQVQQDWKTLEPKDRILFYEKLLKYVVPTLQATNQTPDFDPRNVVIRVIKEGKPGWNKEQLS